MPFFLAPLASFLASAFAFLIKHPFVTKMMFFSIFIGIIATALSFLFDLVRPYILSSTALSIAYQLGLFQALALYITIVLAGFGVKQVLAFIRS
jgi:vacuolar-type H+-ATPase subunit I/STV1